MAEVSVAETDCHISKHQRQLELLSSKEWFYADLSEHQASVILKSKSEDSFLVTTNNRNEGYFSMYLKLQSRVSHLSIEKVKKVEGEEELYTYRLKESDDDRVYENSNVVDLVDEFISQSTHFAECYGRPRFGGPNFSVSSAFMEHPPDYSAAASCQDAYEPIPTVQLDVGPAKYENEIKQESNDTPAIKQESNDTPAIKQESSDTPKHSMDHTRFHRHCYRHLHHYHPKNISHFCCHRGYKQHYWETGEYEERDWYDIRGASILYACILIFMVYIPCSPCILGLFLCICICCPHI